MFDDLELFGPEFGGRLARINRYIRSLLDGTPPPVAPAHGWDVEMDQLSAAMAAATAAINKVVEEMQEDMGRDMGDRS